MQRYFFVLAQNHDSNAIVACRHITVMPLWAREGVDVASASRIHALNPKNGHFDNKVLKSLHFKTVWVTRACNIPVWTFSPTFRSRHFVPDRGGAKLKVPFASPTGLKEGRSCLLYTSPSPRDVEESRMPSSA